jgi:hypothetical protein
MKNERRTLINRSWVLAGEMRRIKGMVLLALCLLVPASTQPLLADITNGGFSAGLSGWTASENVLYDNGRAVLMVDDEQEPSASTLSQDGIYLLPSDRWLSFDFVMAKSEAGGETDIFTASFGTHLRTWEASAIVGDSYSETVSLDLAGWASGPYELLFELTNDPDGISTSVAIDNVQLSAVPVPGAVALGSLGVGFAGWMLRRRAR